MAITQDDFKKVWASTSSVPEYTFSDTDYKNGWEFVGNLPPTRAMWDELQRKNDEKMQFLQENGSMCFDSVTDMKSSNLDAGQTAFTKGYYSINDGGSGTYSIRGKVDGETEDGGSIIFLDNGNVAELITEGTVNVKQFGAKGDGITDDTDCIQNALNAMKDVGVLLFPNGTYIIAPSNESYICMLPAINKVEIKGESLYSTVKIKDNAGTYVAMFGIQCTNLYVHDITFDHNCTNNILTDAEYQDVSHGRYTFTNWAVGLCDTVIMENINVLNLDGVCSVYIPYRAAGWANEVRVNNCRFVGVQNGDENGNLLDYDQSTINVCANRVVVVNNTFKGNSWNNPPRTAIETHSWRECIISNNIIDTYIVGILPCGSERGIASKNYTVTNNVMTTGRCGILPWTTDDQSTPNIAIGMENIAIVNNIIDMRPDLVPYERSVFAATTLAAIHFYNHGSKHNGLKNVNIENNIITYPVDANMPTGKNYTRLTGTNSWGGIYISLIDSVYDNHLTNLSIRNNDIFNCPYAGIFLYKATLSGLIITGNRLHNCATYSSESTVADSSQSKKTYVFINCLLESDAYINNNVFEDYSNPSNVVAYMFLNDSDSSPTHYYHINDNVFDVVGIYNESIVDYVQTGTSSKLIKFNGKAPNATKPRLPIQLSNTGCRVNVNGVEYIKFDSGNSRWNQVAWDASYPTSGAHVKGDIVYNTSPSAEGYIGWVCTATANPGTWKGFGAIEA